MDKLQFTPWFERKFEPINDNGRLATIIERLDGTEFRLTGKLVAEAGDYDFAKSYDGKWSILQEMGHLYVLEPLWLGRVKDIINGKEFLREADLTNKKTNKGNFNSKEVDDLLDDFGDRREELLHVLKNLRSEDLEKSAKHPRLLTPMRIIDLAYFVAEHDDHHLMRISMNMERQQ